MAPECHVCSHTNTTKYFHDTFATHLYIHASEKLPRDLIATLVSNYQFLLRCLGFVGEFASELRWLAYTNLRTSTSFNFIGLNTQVFTINMKNDVSNLNCPHQASFEILWGKIAASEKLRINIYFEICVLELLITV